MGKFGDAYILKVNEEKNHLLDRVITGEDRDSIRFLSEANQCVKARHGAIAGII